MRSGGPDSAAGWRPGHGAAGYRGRRLSDGRPAKEVTALVARPPKITTSKTSKIGGSGLAGAPSVGPGVPVAVAEGGEPVAVTTPAPNILQQWQEALPGGRGVLLTLFQGTPAQARVAVVGPEGGVAREILRGTMARYVPTGHVVYSTPSGTLLAAPFDVEQLAIAGPAVPLVEGVAVDSTGVAEFAVSRSGALLYATGIGSVSELVWVTRAGAAAWIMP